MAGLEAIVGHVRSAGVVAAVLCGLGWSRRRVPPEYLRVALGYVRGRAADLGDGSRKVSVLEMAAGLAMDLGDYGGAKALFAEALDVVERGGWDEVSVEDLRYHCDVAEGYGRGVRLLAAEGDAVAAARCAKACR